MGQRLRATAHAALGLAFVGSVDACAPPPPTAPTLQAQATQVVAPTVSAGQTQVAPVAGAAQAAAQATATAAAATAQAVATLVAPTVAAAATTTVGAVGTQVAQSTIQVTNVNIDSADTSVTVKNSGDRSENLRDWTLVMGPVFAVQLGDIEVPAGQSVKLHFAVGSTTPSDVYLGFGSNAASNNLKPGMRVVLVAPREQIASVYSL